MVQTLVWGPSMATLAIVVMCLLLVWRHGGNISKLMQGTESRIGQKAAPPTPDTDKPAAARAAKAAKPPRGARQNRRRTH